MPLLVTASHPYSAGIAAAEVLNAPVLRVLLTLWKARIGARWTERIPAIVGVWICR